MPLPAANQTPVFTESPIVGSNITSVLADQTTTGVPPTSVVIVDASVRSVASVTVTSGSQVLSATSGFPSVQPGDLAFIESATPGIPVGTKVLFVEGTYCILDTPATAGSTATVKFIPAGRKIEEVVVQATTTTAAALVNIWLNTSIPLGTATAVTSGYTATFTVSSTATLGLVVGGAATVSGVAATGTAPSGSVTVLAFTSTTITTTCTGSFNTVTAYGTISGPSTVTTVVPSAIASGFSAVITVPATSGVAAGTYVTVAGFNEATAAVNGAYQVLYTTSTQVWISTTAAVGAVTTYGTVTGTNYVLFDQITVGAVTLGASGAAFRAEKVYADLIVPAGWQLSATTTVAAQPCVVTARGGSF